jgi:hypothetical protein
VLPLSGVLTACLVCATALAVSVQHSLGRGTQQRLQDHCVILTTLLDLISAVDRSTCAAGVGVTISSGTLRHTEVEQHTKRCFSAVCYCCCLLLPLLLP